MAGKEGERELERRRGARLASLRPAGAARAAAAVACGRGEETEDSDCGDRGRPGGDSPVEATSAEGRRLCWLPPSPPLSLSCAGGCWFNCPKSFLALCPMPRGRSQRRRAWEGRRGVTSPAYQQGSSGDLLQGPFLGSSLCGSKLQPHFSC